MAIRRLCEYGNKSGTREYFVVIVGGETSPLTFEERGVPLRGVTVGSFRDFQQFRPDRKYVLEPLNKD